MPQSHVDGRVLPNFSGKALGGSSATNAGRLGIRVLWYLKSIAALDKSLDT